MPAAADSIAESMSYAMEAPGKQFVFVMIPPISLEREMASWNEETAAKIKEIRRSYPRSGMYRTDGSKEPIWTVDWYADVVDVTADGDHVVRHGPWAEFNDDRRPDLSFEAVSFFARGQLLRTYAVRELVDNPASLSRSVSHYWWERTGRISGPWEYTMQTGDGNRFVFDVRTGEIVSQQRMALVSWALWRLLPGAFLLAVCVAFARLIHSFCSARGPAAPKKTHVLS